LFKCRENQGVKGAGHTTFNAAVQEVTDIFCFDFC